MSRLALTLRTQVGPHPRSEKCKEETSQHLHAACEWSTRVLPPPIAHGTDDRAEVATLGGEDVLGPRGAHRIEAPLDDAILLKRPETLR